LEDDARSRCPDRRDRQRDQHPAPRPGSRDPWRRMVRRYAIGRSPIHAIDFAEYNALPERTSWYVCCGMAVARGASNGGVWGAAPGATLIPIVCAQDQTTTQVTLSRAIAYAADPSMERQPDDGADIISCSLGPRGDDWPISGPLDLALRFA